MRARDVGHAVPDVAFPEAPEDLGYLAGYAVSALAEGTITGKVGETFKAGKLGTYKIIKGPDGKPQVILGPPFTFTIKNVDKFNF